MKLWTIYKAFQVRRERSKAFGEQGTYRPIQAEGKLSECILAYGRGDDVTVVVPRLVMKTQGGWGDTAVTLPAGEWTNVLSDEKLKAGTVKAQQLLDTFPVALLIKQRDA